MKLKLNKNKLKNLSKDHKALPAEMTPNVAGGKHIEVTDPKKYCGGNTDNFGCSGTGCASELC
ncbi:hypothetical protein SG34_030235 [Thalassomonas viridans]|uniref:Uncharacterized protein n=1 Tax=Thalassomonas viridans TaxID=137584 RepID=A0AAE9Z952_9GAMM|nr:hypothetical protein [Thalassomonas viridans]WDE09056.1 hypothetical protein SG34_030235 [Thalassomonas viridans]